MSLEKCVAVYFPLKSKTVYTVRTAKRTTGIVGIILAAYDLQWFVLMEPQISEWSGVYSCVAGDRYHESFHLVDSVLYSYGPFLFMFIINFAIVLRFMRAKCKSNHSTESTNQALVKSATRGTAMVVTVSVTFLLLTAPTAVNDALWHIFQLDSIPFYHSFMNLTQYLNHSINGVLYCIVGSRFRMEPVKILYRKGRPEGLSYSNSGNNTSLTNINGSRP